MMPCTSIIKLIENPRRQKNLMAMHEMIYSVAEKYSDLCVQVGDRVFKSNRLILAAVSEYFHAQLERWTCKEEPGKAQTIVLHEIDADIFEKILEFINSGQIDISDSNVSALLRASDYLLLRNNLIQEECFNYLRTASQPILHALEMLEFSHIKSNEALLEVLSEHVLRHMDHFLKEPAFKEIPFDCLNSILKCNQHIYCKKDYILLQVINSWIDHSRVKRKEHRDELMAHIKAANICPSDYLALINRYENFLDRTATGEGTAGVRTTEDSYLLYPVSTCSETLGKHGCCRECNSCSKTTCTGRTCGHCHLNFCRDCYDVHTRYCDSRTDEDDSMGEEEDDEY